MAILPLQPIFGGGSQPMVGGNWLKSIFSIFRPFARISKLHFFEFPKKNFFTPPYWTGLKLSLLLLDLQWSVKQKFKLRRCIGLVRVSKIVLSHDTHRGTS